jgi:hypothetical protein
VSYRISAEYDKYTQDFRLFGVDTIERGVYHEESDKSNIIPTYHESIGEIVNTCKHEDKHCVISHIIKQDDLLIDIDMEHWAIRQMMWADESL